MAAGMNLTIYRSQGWGGTDITQLVQMVKIEGRRSSPTRKMTVTLIDDDGYKHDRSGIDIESGVHTIFRWNGQELFRGIFMKQTGSNKKSASYLAYDNAVYLSNNKDTFCYEYVTASTVFRDVCNRFGLPVGAVASCGYVIPDLTKSKTTGWDAISDALSLEFDNTGVSYYVSSEKGVLHLRRRQESIVRWVLETGVNISSYSYEKSIESVKTRIKLLSDEGTVLAFASDPALEAKIGIMQDVATQDETLTHGQLYGLVNSMLAEKKVPSRTLKLTDALGQPNVISGTGVLVTIPHLGIGKTWYVDQDTHTFMGNKHTMTLSLKEVSTTTSTVSYTQTQGTASQAAFKVGDRVRVRDGAKTYGGGTKLQSWCYDYVFTVIQVGGSGLSDDRIVIGINGAVTAAMNAADLYAA